MASCEQCFVSGDNESLICQIVKNMVSKSAELIECADIDRFYLIISEIKKITNDYGEILDLINDSMVKVPLSKSDIKANARFRRRQKYNNKLINRAKSQTYVTIKI